MTSALQGTHIVVTRPAHQAEMLCSLITQNGGVPIRFPVLEIVAPGNGVALSAVLDRLAICDIAIFISANAVQWAMPLINDRGGLPDTVSVAAVGQSTARALAGAGHPADICPDQQFNSEALLDTAALQQANGKRIVIFRGEGGREHLADILRQRGAMVEYAECYRRARPDTGVAPLLQAWQQGQLDIIIVTSNEGLQNLHDMIRDSDQAESLLSKLLDTPLLLISERTAMLARQLGFTQAPIIATKASDDALLQALIDWRQIKKNQPRTEQ